METQSYTLLPMLTMACQQFESEVIKIPGPRKVSLLQLSDYLQKKYFSGDIPKIISICTHNSRRSHILQLWLAVAAEYYHQPSIFTFSGGTEATAFNSRAVAALRRIGFQIEDSQIVSDNPIYNIRWKAEMSPYQAFSKKYTAPPNPKKDFAAIMVCTQADEACPTVMGAEFRLALPYDDPKNFDDTPHESEKYDERVRQIGREILFAFSQIKLQS
jgi:protein-tyrosine-phosphatase